ncbi:thioredoxin-like (seleno)protein SaoT [Desulfonatronum sp. SC1]|uniref:thioredoxin-like (seleno)protein SaoT n=1 Tax=Desulfonatronum sp. SC1 TaxID=2109626 RepID=UPI000D315996|nr:thioredoxin-like (seleno)protein SaoT [Desulfonatronum sp. SC1]PTN32249.1 thioredoxin family protein [Desulfonatronum sp. SC1]
MAKVQIEFINTCPCCDEHGATIQDIAARYGDDIDVFIYNAGKDFGYLKKYGMISKGTMIINGVKRYENLSKEIIEQAISQAMAG